MKTVSKSASNLSSAQRDAGDRPDRSASAPAQRADAVASWLFVGLGVIALAIAVTAARADSIWPAGRALNNMYSDHRANVLFQWRK